MNAKEFIQILAQTSDSNAPLPQDLSHLLNPVDKGLLSGQISTIEEFRNLDFEEVEQRNKLIDKYNRYVPEKKQKNYSIKKKSWDGIRAYLIGELFEQLIEIIFSKSLIFQIGKRIHTDASEIDILLTMRDPCAKAVRILDDNTHVICEGKCHTVTPKSEWVNKLAGVMTSHETSMGFLFVFPKEKKAGLKFRNSIKDHFRSSQVKLKIIPFGIKQFKEIAQGKSFVEVLEQQHSLAKIGAASLHF